jgi:hypothetical protein
MPNQVIAGVNCVPVVDINLVPITVGCTLKASVPAYTGRWVFRDIVVVVEQSWLPYCVLRGEDWAIPFYYDAERRVMIGGRCSMTWPVWCEVAPTTRPFYHG